jgi:hypothetical protein
MACTSVIRITALVTGLMWGTAVLPTSALAESPACTAPGELTRLDQGITHTAARLAEGHALKIVAFGSSSTAGTGASSPAHTYPARLQAELRDRFPETDITVLNRGVGGEDAKEMLASSPRTPISSSGRSAPTPSSMMRRSPSRRRWCAPALPGSRLPISTSSSSTRNTCPR